MSTALKATLPWSGCTVGSRARGTSGSAPYLATIGNVTSRVTRCSSCSSSCASSSTCSPSGLDLVFAAIQHAGLAMDGGDVFLFFFEGISLVPKFLVSASLRRGGLGRSGWWQVDVGFYDNETCVAAVLFMMLLKVGSCATWGSAG